MPEMERTTQAQQTEQTRNVTEKALVTIAKELQKMNKHLENIEMYIGEATVDRFSQICSSLDYFTGRFDKLLEER